MGFDVNRFQGTVDEELLCSICSAVLEDPVDQYFNYYPIGTITHLHNIVLMCIL